MSIKTWKAEFYPVSASKCKKVDALDHAILKWSGTTKAAMKRHGLTIIDKYVVDEQGRGFPFTVPTCALCRHSSTAGLVCCDCVIEQTTGMSCFEAYLRWCQTGDPKPMLALLRKVKRALARKGKR